MVRGTGTNSSLTFASTADTPSSPTSISPSLEYTAASSSGRAMTNSSNASSILSHQQPQTPVEDDTDSCSLDPDAWFAQFHDQEIDLVQVSDELPTRSELERAANIPVLDSDGTSRPFQSLFTGDEHIGQRQLIIFVRHFYCAACQSFLKSLTSYITPSAYFSLPIPTTITIIGCGAPNQIPAYSTTTTCPFRIYTEPTRRLYKTLGMRWSVKFGKRPDFANGQSIGKVFFDSVIQMAKAGPRNILLGGPMTQIGGEFMFEDGQPIWCHRMTNVRNHTEMPKLKKVLEMDDEVSRVEEATAMPMSPSSSARGLKLVWDGGNQAHLSRGSRTFTQDA